MPTMRIPAPQPPPASEPLQIAPKLAGATGTAKRTGVASLRRDLTIPQSPATRGSGLNIPV